MNLSLTQRLLEVAAVGGEWVLWGLLLLSVISLGIMLDRFWWFSRHRCNVDVLVAQLLDKADKGEVEAALKILRDHPSQETQMAAKCLDWQDSGTDAMANMLEVVIRERRPVLERGLLFLGTLGNNAPFIGLFGTVLGVVQAFVELGKHAGGGMDKVMGSIGEALIATAVGILVAIPAVVAFNLLSRKVAQVEDNVQVFVNLFAAVRSRQEKRKS